MSWCFILRDQFIDYVITFWEHLNQDFSLNCRHPNSPILMPWNVCYLAGRAEEAEGAACWHPGASSRHSCQPRAAAPAGCLRLHVIIRIYRQQIIWILHLQAPLPHLHGTAWVCCIRQWGGREWGDLQIFSTVTIEVTYLSCVTCHVSCVMCHVSCVMCHVSRVTCHVSCVTCGTRAWC